MREDKSPTGASQLEYLNDKDLEEKEDRGKGFSGIVKRGYWKDVEVAIKSVEASQKDILHELALMASLPPHPNVLRLYGVCLQPKIRMVLEYINGGSLDKQLPPFQKDLPRLLRAARDISLGMAHLHKNGIIHGDLATRNILIQTSPTTEIFKISDFGLSRLDHSKNEFQSRLPLKWMAPENIRGKNGKATYVKGSDVWMFANTIIELFLGKPDPLPDDLPYEQVLGAKIRDTGYHPKRPSSCTDKVWDLLLRCWLIFPSARPNFYEIIVIYSDSAIPPHRSE
eukprot:TRINITY_DN143_c0_g1_i2.p1 TRINITY_DN143_c0_g1~~TRINITY_DN143_c0_g1_i2.p1  ORF type:complete len:283 (+),score=49.90 TRINITY_DN143_c0_g1_i2:181-1029(+)